jgi:hypothetical protein
MIRERGMSEFEAWNESSVLLVAAAKVYNYTHHRNLCFIKLNFL